MRLVDSALQILYTQMLHLASPSCLLSVTGGAWAQTGVMQNLYVSTSFVHMASRDSKRLPQLSAPKRWEADCGVRSSIYSTCF